jgi:prephenate dehydrogenase
MSIDSIAMLGASGRMGGLFRERCEAAGIEFRAVGRPYTDEGLTAVLTGVDMVLVSVPAYAFEAAIERIVPFMKAPTILADVTSVKEIPLETMLRHYDGPVVGTHPLFGPLPPENAQVVLNFGRDEEAVQRCAEFFQRLGFGTFESSAVEHDKAMAMIQNLNFVTTVSYAAALCGFPSLQKYMTPSLTRRLDAAEKMLTEDAAMFSALFEANPYSQEAVRSFRSMLNIAAGGDVELLAERAALLWSEDFHEHDPGDDPKRS